METNPMTDITEKLARAIAPELEGEREFDRMPPDKVARRKWHREGMCGPNDATQEDAREVVGLMLPIIARREREAVEAMRERCAGVAEWQNPGSTEYQRGRSDAATAIRGLT